MCCQHLAKLMCSVLTHTHAKKKLKGKTKTKKKNLTFYFKSDTLQSLQEANSVVFWWVHSQTLYRFKKKKKKNKLKG